MLVFFAVTIRDQSRMRKLVSHGRAMCSQLVENCHVRQDVIEMLQYQILLV